MSDAFWSGLFANAPAIIGAIFAGIAMLVSLLNGRKANKAVVKMEAVSQEVSQTKQIAQQAVEKTELLQDGQRFLSQSLATNTFDTAEIKKAIEKRNSGFGELDP